MTDSGAIILAYHRVGSFGRDPHGLAVTTERFAEQLDYLRRNIEVVPLEAIQGSARASVAITFDDGYWDNAAAAGEMLHDSRLPATFFITAGRVGATDEFWWDRLDRILLTSKPVGRHIDVVVAGRALWADARTPAARERIYWALYHRLKPLPIPDIEDIVDQVARQLGDSSEERDTHRMMSTEELRGLAAVEGFEIGAHSSTHPLLATQTPEVQRAEIAGSRETLERFIDGPVRSFSYPYGADDAFSTTTTRLVADAGYARACTAMAGRAGPASDPFRLPRRVVLNWEGEDFGHRLTGWLEQ
jgi:peptidoglycan/xylan/chitin deacetylase (PgdA/CDA1 family)